MFRKIRWRIAVPYVLLIILFMVALGFYLSSRVRQIHLADLEEAMGGEAGLLASVLAADWDNITETQFDDFAREWADIIDARVTIVAEDGVVLGESDQDRTQMDNHALRPEIQKALREGIGSSIRYSATIGYDMLYVAAPAAMGGENIAVVRIAFPLRQIEESIANLQRTIWIFSSIAALLAVLLALWIAGFTTRPIVRLTKAANQIADGDLSGHLYLGSMDEVGQMSQALDRMAKQLQDRIEALQSEQVKLSAVLAQMTDGVVIVDKQGVLSLLNPSAEQIFELGREDALGSSLVRAFGQHQLYELWQECRSSGEEKMTTLSLTHQNRFVQVIATPLGGELEGSTLLLCQDLTHLRRLETVRRDFISNISHELRTPLASLKALAETLQFSALEDPETARHFLERMDTEIDALTQMVNELLELARIESGRVPLDIGSVNACQLLSDASERLNMQAERAGVSLALDCPDNLPDIRADATRLEQVLVNIIHNAVKFTPPGGTITVFARHDGAMVRFGVRDTGVGIASDMLPRVFERFYKTDEARTGGGTGLGLSISRHLVEAHSGRIWAEGKLGEGSTFYFTIPAVPKTTAS